MHVNSLAIAHGSATLFNHSSQVSNSTNDTSPHLPTTPICREKYSNVSSGYVLAALRPLISGNIRSNSLLTFSSQTMTEATQLVYQKDGQRLLHGAKVVSIVPVSELPPPDKDLVKDASDVEHAIITDSTIFHVQGGGQPSDIGTMAPSDDAATKDTPTFQVKSVRQPAEGNQILHFGRFDPSNGSFKVPFTPGDALQQHVDAEKRLLHSRLHSAGHIMSLAIHALCREGVLPPLKESKASHYPDSASVVFIGSLEAKHKDVIQAKTDEFVKSARPIKIHWWSMEELMQKCYASEGFTLPEGETMGRVVEMEGLGSYPCGGTHVQDCSQVGRIEVKKIARSKGTTKVSYRVA